MESLAFTLHPIGNRQLFQVLPRLLLTCIHHQHGALCCSCQSTTLGPVMCGRTGGETCGAVSFYSSLEFGLPYSFYQAGLIGCTSLDQII